MQYYSIEFDTKLDGEDGLFQVDEIEHNCDVRNDSRFIDRFPFEFIEIQPVLSYPIVRDSFDLTDILKMSSIGFSSGSIVISDKLKSILDEHNVFGLQFFKTKVKKSGNYFTNYWQTHVYENPFNLVDFKKSKLLFSNRDENRKKYYEEIKVDDWVSFISIAKDLRYPKRVFIDQVKFTEGLSLDYLHLRHFPNGGTRGMVSERLKTAIESNDITGIDFRPIEIPPCDWYRSRYS